MHQPVLLTESLRPLLDTGGGLFVDCTMGGGGHLEQILKSLPESTVIGIDQDQQAIRRISEKFGKEIEQKRLILKHGNFRNLRALLAEIGVSQVNGLLADLGVSSFHYDEADRGFSFQNDGPLDMRMDQSGALTAAQIVNRWSRDDLISILRRYGDEKFAPRIAGKIVAARNDTELRTTLQLVELISQAIPEKDKRSRKGHFATKTFQALRIAVNDELGAVEDLLQQIPEVLHIKGVASIIAFHSTEDRLVKQRFKFLSDSCICPKEIITCERCNKPPVELINRKPITAGQQELDGNPRSRSAKLRVIRRIR